MWTFGPIVPSPATTGSLADDDDDGGRIPADVFRPGFCYRCPITDSPPTRADLSPFISPRALVILTGTGHNHCASHMHQWVYVIGL